MREEFKPGDLSVRLSFVNVMGTSPDANTIAPTLEVTDRTSGRRYDARP